MRKRRRIVRRGRALDQFNPLDGAKIVQRLITRVIVDHYHFGATQIGVPTQQTQTDLRDIQGPEVRHKDRDFFLTIGFHAHIPKTVRADRFTPFL